MSAIQTIDKFTVLAEHLSLNGKKADPIIKLIKEAEAAGCQHLMRGLIDWIVSNFDMEPNGGSIDFVYHVLNTLERRRIAVLTEHRQQFTDFARRYTHDIQDNLTPIFSLNDLRGKKWDGYYVIHDKAIEDRIYLFLAANKLERINYNFVK